MSINTRTLVEKVFEREVHKEFQESGMMLNACRMRNIKAKSVQFPVMGAQSSNEHVLGAPVEATNGTRRAVNVNVKDYTSASYVEGFLQDKVSFDEKSELAASIAMELGRRRDQVMIDALNRDVTAQTVANNISGSVANLTVAAFRKAGELLDEVGVPSTDRYAIVTPSGINSLLSDSQATSSDFVTVQALTNGTIDTFYGFKIIKIGKNGGLGGLPIDGSNDRTNFFYHKNALGCAISQGPTVRADYVPEKVSDIVVGKLSVGSEVIDGTGVVKVITRES